MHICPEELVAFGLLITFAKPVAMLEGMDMECETLDELVHECKSLEKRGYV